MKVLLLENIKYRGKYYKKGDTIELKESLIDEFIKNKLIAKKGQEVEKNDVSEQDTIKDKGDINIIGIEDSEKANKGDIDSLSIDDLKKDEIIAILEENEIKHNKKATKEELFDLLPL